MPLAANPAHPYPDPLVIMRRVLSDPFADSLAPLLLRVLRDPLAYFTNVDGYRIMIITHGGSH
jgi:hypothetical protein